MLTRRAPAGTLTGTDPRSDPRERRPDMWIYLVIAIGLLLAVGGWIDWRRRSTAGWRRDAGPGRERADSANAPITNVDPSGGSPGPW